MQVCQNEKTVIQQQKLVITAERLAAAEKRYCSVGGGRYRPFAV